MDDYRPTLGATDSSSEDDTYGNQKPHSGKRRDTRTKDERMLGIWADYDDEHGGKERRMSAAKPILNTLKPTEFVAASGRTAEPGNDNDESDYVGTRAGQPKVHDNSIVNAPLDRDDDSETDSSSGSDEADSSLEAYSGISDSEHSVRQHINGSRGIGVRSRKPTQQKVGKEFGKFTNNTVWNMMAKMGYKAGEGLGKHGEGRVEPVQVVLRRAGEGISYSRSERPPDPRHATEPARAKPRRREDMGLDDQADVATPSKAKSKAYLQRIKVEYKTLEQLQQRTDARMKDVFVDMATNIQAGSLAELVSRKLPLSEKEQLVRDARLGLDLAFSKLEHIKREKDIEEGRNSALNKDIARLSSSISQRRKRVEYLSKVEHAIETVHDKANGIATTSIDNAADDMKDLYMSFHELHDIAQNTEDNGCGYGVWRELQLEQVVTNVMSDRLKCILDMWKPTEHMQVLADLLAPLQMHISTNDDNLQAEDMTPFESLLNHILLPRLKRFIFTEWDPLSDNLGKILDILPQTSVFSISSDIGSVLQRFVDGLNTRTIMSRYNSTLAENSGSISSQTALAPLRVDRAIIPWLPFISDPSELLSSIRRKLCAVLDLWIPSRRSNNDIIALVSPWLQVLQDKNVYKLCAKVVDRLECMLKSEFQFNAQKQSTWAFKALMEWHGILPFDVWFSVVKKGVMSRFLDYLWAWLQQPNRNYSEIADWYWQWKRMYPDDIFAHPDVESEFRKALIYMAHSMALS